MLPQVTAWYIYILQVPQTSLLTLKVAEDVMSSEETLETIM